MSMNILKIFSEIGKLPIRKEHLKLIYDAWSIFKSKDFKGKPSEIDSIMKELGMRREHLKNLLPYLDRPEISNVLERVMPNSTQGLKDLANHVMAKQDPSTHSREGITSGESSKKFPQLP